MTTTTIKPVDELELGDTFSFPDDEDHNLYVLEETGWRAESVQPLRLTYAAFGDPSTTALYHTQHACNELVEVWT